MNLQIFISLLSLFMVIECKLPDYINVCKRNDPNLNDCITKSIYSLIPKLSVGIPELNIPPIEPFHIKNVDLSTGSKAVHFNGLVKDMLISKLSTMEILDLKSNIEENTFKVTLRVPELQSKGKYEVDAKIMTFHLKGEGPMSMNVTEYRCEAVLRGKRIILNGVEHLQFEKSDFNITVGSAKVNLENLFHGNQNLGKTTNDVINDNISGFYEYIKPNVEHGLGEALIELANEITLSFSFDELFPL